jgi:hypothetical protein
MVGELQEIGEVIDDVRRRFTGISLSNKINESYI